MIDSSWGTSLILMRLNAPSADVPAHIEADTDSEEEQEPFQDDPIHSLGNCLSSENDSREMLIAVSYP